MFRRKNRRPEPEELSQLRNEIRDQADAYLPSVPQRFEPDQIGRLLEKGAFRRKKDKRFYRSIAITATAVFVCISVVAVTILPSLGERHRLLQTVDNEAAETTMAAPMLPGGDTSHASQSGSNQSEPSEIVTVKSYDELYQFVDGLYKVQEANRAAEKGTFWDRIFNGMEKATANMAPETAAGSNDVGMDAATINESKHSKTNTQVENVDEADIVKTDGKYIYHLSNGRVIITRSENGKLDQCAVITDDVNHVNEMYYMQNRLLLLGTESDSPGTNVTKATVYDVSDRSKPKRIKSYTQDGGYISSRMIAGKLFLVTNHYYDQKPRSAEEKAKYVPGYVLNGGSRQFVPVQDIMVSKKTNTVGYVIASCWPVMQDGNPQFKSVLGGAKDVYASTQNLYVMCPTSKKSGGETYDATNIIRFAIEDGKMRVAAQGTVWGTTLNQFSADESNGTFRIATTYSRQFDNMNRSVAGSNSASGIYVLDMNLKVIGKIEGLGKTESIYSVRFMDKTAYVVTFRQTDPLYVVSLANPNKPVLKGELKIPGFSNYLHPLTETLMIGVGQQADENGRVTGFKLSLFDVSNPEKPIEKFHKIIQGETVSSMVSDTHKAFLLDDRDPDHPLVGLPLARYDYDYAEGNYSGYIMYRIDPDKGFSQAFWTDWGEQYPGNYGYRVSRGLYIGDYLYLIGENRMASYHYGDFKEIDFMDY